MKKKLLLPVLAFVLIASFGGGCYYDVESELYGMNCDTTGTKYSTNISAIISNYGCLACHAGGNPSGGINLENHANLKLSVNNGKLMGSISHASGFIPMPDGAAKMNQCDINRIKAWIAAGAPDN